LSLKQRVGMWKDADSESNATAVVQAPPTSTDSSLMTFFHCSPLLRLRSWAPMGAKSILAGAPMSIINWAPIGKKFHHRAPSYGTGIQRVVVFVFSEPLISREIASDGVPDVYFLPPRPFLLRLIVSPLPVSHKLSVCNHLNIIHSFRRSFSNHVALTLNHS
jgi:hypothetical protein